VALPTQPLHKSNLDQFAAVTASRRPIRQQPSERARPWVEVRVAAGYAGGFDWGRSAGAKGTSPRLHPRGLTSNRHAGRPDRQSIRAFAFTSRWPLDRQRCSMTGTNPDSIRALQCSRAKARRHISLWRSSPRSSSGLCSNTALPIFDRTYGTYPPTLRQRRPRRTRLKAMCGRPSAPTIILRSPRQRANKAPSRRD
jgi:hypothetical protein